MVSIKNDYEAQPGRENYSTMVEFDIEEGFVRIYEHFGNGQSMRSFHGLNRNLGHKRSAQFASVDPLVALLEGEEAQDLLAAITEGFKPHWNGSNHVGRLTEHAQTALSQLEDLVEECWESLPTLWGADEWFYPAGFYGNQLLELIESHGSLEEAVNNEVVLALPEHLDDEDVAKYFRDQLNELTESEDTEVVKRTHKLLNLKTV